MSFASHKKCCEQFRLDCDRLVLNQGPNSANFRENIRQCTSIETPLRLYYNYENICYSTKIN